MADYEDYGPVAPSPTRTAIEILRARFPDLLRDNEDATLSYDPTGSLAVKNLRDARLGELSDRLINDEASTAIPQEGYVPGEPGRRIRSNAPDVFNALRTRGQLGRLSAEAAADPYTGEAEQGRVADVRDALTKASLTTRPELEDQAKALASRNAFAEFMKKQAGYKAEVSPEGQQALEAESRRKVAEAGARGETGRPVQVADPEHPGQTIWVRRDEAAGSQAPPTAQVRERLQAYDSLIQLADDISKLGDETGWKGIGPIEGPVGSALMGYAGIGDPKAEQLRTRMGELLAESSFARGGKNLTGTEREMVNAFLTSVNRDPAQAKVRLDQFRESARRTMGSMMGATPSGTTPSGGGGGRVYYDADGNPVKK